MKEQEWTLKLPSEKPDPSCLGFRDAVYDAYRKAYKAGKAAMDYSEDNTELARMQSACKAVNEKYDRMRRSIATDLQNYLLANDGKIDAWTSSSGYNENIYFGPPGDVSATVYNFDYFSDDFVVKNGKPARKSDRFVYRNAYHYTETNDFKRAETKRTMLEVEYEDAMKAMKKEQRSWLNYILPALGIVYLVYAVLCLLLLHINGRDGLPFESFLEQLLLVPDGAENEMISQVKYLGNVILCLPIVLYEIMVALSLKRVYWFLFILILAVIAFCLLFLVTFMRETHGHRKKCKDLTKVYRKAKAEFKKFVDSAEYQTSVAENARLRKCNEEFAEKWQRAWFDWVRKESKGPLPTFTMDPPKKK